MKASLLNCDLPMADLPKQFQPWYFRVVDARLVSPPPRFIPEYEVELGEECQHFAHISERFFDVRTMFGYMRGIITTVMTLFTIIVGLLLWIASLFFGSSFLDAYWYMFVPVWAGAVIFDVLFPRSLPVRFDQKERCVYVACQGTYYRIPWDKLMVTISYNWQYYGSYVYWRPRFYLHLYMDAEYHFTGRKPKKTKRVRLASFDDEERMCRFWNTLYSVFEGGLSDDEIEKIREWNKSEAQSARDDGEPFGPFMYVFTFIVNTYDYIRPHPLLKFKWPPEIEEKFGKANYY